MRVWAGRSGGRLIFSRGTSWTGPRSRSWCVRRWVTMRYSRHRRVREARSVGGNLSTVDVDGLAADPVAFVEQRNTMVLVTSFPVPGRPMGMFVSSRSQSARRNQKQPNAWQIMETSEPMHHGRNSHNQSFAAIGPTVVRIVAANVRFIPQCLHETGGRAVRRTRRQRLFCRNSLQKAMDLSSTIKVIWVGVPGPKDATTALFDEKPVPA